jgi:hypothetical protein
MFFAIKKKPLDNATRNDVFLNWTLDSFSLPKKAIPMSVVVKRTRKNSTTELKTSLQQLIQLLEGQKEDDAVADLRIALGDIEKVQPESEEFKAAIRLVHECFEGDHELIAYTFNQGKDGRWSEVEELYLASTTVFNLVKRLNKIR